jgi:hypothetical protein
MKTSLANAFAVVSECREYPSLATTQVVNAAQTLVRDIAARLHEIEPSTMGLLRCVGFTPEPMRCRFALRFQYPSGKSAVGTLRSLLVHEENSHGVQHTLSDRVLLARKLASAVLYMHTCDFVHKSTSRQRPHLHRRCATWERLSRVHISSCNRRTFPRGIRQRP